MKIISYSAGGNKKEQLQYPKLFFKEINLIVGDSGTGKTRLLNTIFNLGSMVVNENAFFEGWWTIEFEHNGVRYFYELDTCNENADIDEKKNIKSEKLISYKDNVEKIIISRKDDEFYFKEEKLPKLSSRITSIQLLKDEEEIEQIFESFKLIIRRNFSSVDLDEATEISNLPQSLNKKIRKNNDKNELFHYVTNVNCRMYLFKQYFKDIYEDICQEFLSIFPFVKEVEILDGEHFGLSFPGIVPVFSLKESGSKKWVALKDFSSGMKKVLLILTDIYVLPQSGAVYLIDEYENSLGVNAINFFPDVLYRSDSPSQYIITSHHPYIIGNVPVREWIVLHRKGLNVLAKHGEELEEKFGKSKQKAFVKLLNDPFYTEGIE